MQQKQNNFEKERDFMAAFRTFSPYDQPIASCV